MAGRAAEHLFPYTFSVEVHGIGRSPPPALTCAAVRPLRLLIRTKWAVPAARIQRRLTREPHVTEAGQANAQAEALSDSPLCPPPVSRRANQELYLLYAAIQRLEVALRGFYNKNRKEKKKEETPVCEFLSIFKQIYFYFCI